MNSVELCQFWLNNGALFLDTETTGVDESAEIIEIAVINNEESPVYESLIRPRVAITPKLTALAVWDVAARYWAPPKLNEMSSVDLLREVGAKIK